MRLLESSSISPSVRDALAIIHQQALELIVRGASLDAVLEVRPEHSKRIAVVSARERCERFVNRAEMIDRRHLAILTGRYFSIVAFLM